MKPTEGEIPILIFCDNIAIAKNFIRIDLDENLSSQRLEEKFCIITGLHNLEKSHGRQFSKAYVFERNRLQSFNNHVADYLIYRKIPFEYV